MKCFHFSDEERKESQVTKSTSARSNSTTSTDRDLRRSGSDYSRYVSDTSADSIGRSQFPSFSNRSSNLRVFAFSELRSATKNFSHSLMIGEGGFGCVYRGTIKSSEDQHIRLEIAVKQLNRKGLQGQKEWLTEVNVLGIVEHPNLVKLVGFCAEDDERGTQRLLVYEYMPNRSVDDHLSGRSTAPLPWSMRLKVALGAALGLTYLHEEMDFQVIFRDLKTSNILLDEHWNAKLSDFGLARQGPAEGTSHVSTADLLTRRMIGMGNELGGLCYLDANMLSTYHGFTSILHLYCLHGHPSLPRMKLMFPQIYGVTSLVYELGEPGKHGHVSYSHRVEKRASVVVGTIGYAAPEYMRTGHLTAKSDVWSYGVVLYELITGRRPVDRNRPRGEQKLLEWVKPYISDIKKFRMILDPRIEARYSLRSASKLAIVANRCLVRNPKSRPKMSEVLEMVQRIVEDAANGAAQPPVKFNATEETTTDEKKRKGFLKRK